MKTIVKVMESMLSQRATQEWQGLPANAGPSGGWGWGGRGAGGAERGWGWGGRGDDPTLHV